jgi:hypothetical protein
LGFALFADAAAALEEFDDLLQAKGDDQTHADGDEVEEHVVGSEHGSVGSWYSRLTVVVDVVAGHGVQGIWRWNRV